MPGEGGNATVLQYLKGFLELAEKEDFGHIAISMCKYPNIAAIYFGGDIALEKSQEEAMSKLLAGMRASIKNWEFPKRNKKLDASYACFNAANGPLGFDFLVWLVDAEMTRRREGAPDPLKVGLWMGRNLAADDANIEKRRSWIENVFRPAMKMIGAVEDDRAIKGRQAENYVTGNVAKWARDGEEVPRFRSEATTSFEPGAVTITLREASYWTHRNSNVAAWLRFASELRAKGERIIFVRDTEKAAEPLGDFQIDPMASVDLEVRAALYQQAKINLFIGNGPAALAVFGDRPWLQFIALEPDTSKYRPNTAKFWRESQGIEPGQQYPWASPAQRIIWAPDKLENLQRAWAAVEPLLRTNANGEAQGREPQGAPKKGFRRARKIVPDRGRDARKDGDQRRNPKRTSGEYIGLRRGEHQSESAREAR